MDASLMSFTSGAIALYMAPMEKQDCLKYHVLPTHPVLILDENHAAPIYSYNCMVITTKVEKYFGYKIFMNTLDPKWRRMGVVCPERIYSIPKNCLKEILGFAPANFVKKCKEAFMYTIGMSDKIPDYYLGDPMAMEYLNAGSGNVPVEHGGRHCNIGDFSELEVAVDQPPVSPSPEGIIRKVPQSVELDYHEEDMPSDIAPAEVECPRERTEESISSNNTTEIKIDQKPMTFDRKEMIERRAIGPVNVSKKIADAFNMLTDDEIYEIWAGRMTGYRLMKAGYVKSNSGANSLMSYALYRITDKKEELCAMCQNDPKFLQFIGSGYYTAFRCLSLEECNRMRLGIASYQAYCKAFEIDFRKTYLGELATAKLIK